jgi:hypothetical protein
MLMSTPQLVQEIAGSAFGRAMLCLCAWVTSGVVPRNTGFDGSIIIWPIIWRGYASGVQKVERNNGRTRDADSVPVTLMLQQPIDSADWTRTVHT